MGAPGRGAEEGPKGLVLNLVNWTFLAACLLLTRSALEFSTTLDAYSQFMRVAGISSREELAMPPVPQVFATVPEPSVLALLAMGMAVCRRSKWL